MNRRGFLFAVIAPVGAVALAHAQEPPAEPKEEGPPAPNVHTVSVTVDCAISPGIEAEGSIDVRVTGARDLGAAIEAARLTLRRGRIVVVGHRKWD